MHRPVRTVLPAFLALAALALLLVPAPAAAQGCAMCGTVGQGPSDPLVRGMFWSILFMVSMPFAVVGSVTLWLLGQVRRGGAAAGSLPGSDGLVPSTPVVPFRRPRP